MANFETPIQGEYMVTKIQRLLYTAKTQTTGGRNGGVSHSSDGHLVVNFSTPQASCAGTNPEQLFAAAWSACLEAAMGIAARKMEITLPCNLAIDAEVDLCQDNSGYLIQARLHFTLPGIEREVARSLVKAAHDTCPYSK